MVAYNVPLIAANLNGGASAQRPHRDSDPEGSLGGSRQSKARTPYWYNPDQVDQARRIRSLRSLHMPLKDSQVLLATEDRDVIHQQLEEHRQRIGERLQDYRRVLSVLPRIDAWRTSTGKEGSMTREMRYCSFCSKESEEVQRMIAGPGGVVICNECVALCNEVLAREEEQESKAKA